MILTCYWIVAIVSLEEVSQDPVLVGYELDYLILNGLIAFVGEEELDAG